MPERLSYSQISTFQRCAYRYLLRYIHKLAPLETPHALLRGTMLHEAYECFVLGRLERLPYKRRYQSALQRVDQVADEALQTGMSVERVQKAIEAAHTVLEAFLPQSEEMDDWTPLPQEGRLERELIIDVGGYPLIVKFDGLVQRGKRLYILENKFRSRLDLSGLEHDLQTLLYQAAWNNEHPEKPISGIIYNVVSAKPTREGRIVERAEFTHGRNSQISALMTLQQVARLVELHAEHGIWPRHITPNCRWDCDLETFCMPRREGVDYRDLMSGGSWKGDINEDFEI